MATRGGLHLKSSTNRGPVSAPSDEELQQAALVALKATFGFDAFRGQQRDAVLAALRGRDCFVLMPTGGGKSLCFALPAAIRPGVVLVVSPLIALMQDQVQSLRARGLRADFLSSTRNEADRRRLLEDLQQRTPKTQLLYVTPELLATDSFMRCLRVAYTAGSLLLCAVDEAHCVSRWGHSFRHTYRRLWLVRQELPGLAIMACTATASERVQADIVQQLRMREPLMLRASFNRPNIAYEVRYLDLIKGPGGRPLSTPLPNIIALLEQEATAVGGGTSAMDGPLPPPPQQQQRQHEGQPGQQQQQQQGKAQVQVPCTVIYCHRREDADRVSAALRKRGMAAAAYHAGLPDGVRARVLEDWQARRVAVVAATVAFGMGIDRADVRFVLHYSLPKSLEGYYQEAGRAGRDGAPSRSIVYFSTEDRQRQEFVLSKGDERSGKAGPAGSSSSSSRGGDEERHPNQLSQFGQVVDFCLTARCRRAAVLQHFGERAPAGSGPSAGAACCDVCTDGGTVAASIRELASAGAQRRQRFAGGKHTLDFGGTGGAGGAMEFEQRAYEGLDYDQDGPSRALQDSEDEDEEEGDAIRASSGDDEDGAQAAAAVKDQAVRAGGSDSAVFAALARAEERHKQQQAGGAGKKARLLQKLESGGKGSGMMPSSGSGVTDALLQAATGQLAAVLSGNAALAGAVGGSGSTASAGVASALVQQLAAGTVSKPVFQSKLSNLAMQLKKAGAAVDVPALAAVLGSDGGQRGEQQIGGGRMDSQAAGAAADLTGGAGAAWSGQHLQQQVTEVLQLAALAGPAPNPAASSSSGSSDASIEAAVTALRRLADAAVNVDLLQVTGAGKQVQQLKKHGAPAVAAAAVAVVAAWKAQLVAAAAK